MPRRDTHHHGPDILEHGDIYFFYRPKVETDEAAGPEDVQRFHIVLCPEEQPRRFRLLTIGRKRLPDIPGHERTWGFVDRIASAGREIEQELREGTYRTKTRGERTRPAARPAGEGVYALVRENHKLYLAYELELPERPGAVQKDFKIPPRGSFALSIKNPEKPAPPNVGLERREEAHYPERLQREFRDRRFAAEDPRLLDFEGAEFVLVGARLDPERELAIDLEGDHETPGTADIVRQLHLERSQHPFEPLLQGEWR